MDAPTIIRNARTGSGMTLRRLARRAGTSHSTLSAYEAGHVDPSVRTVQRIVRAAGFDLDVSLVPRVGDDQAGERGRELLEVLELAGLFPAHHSPHLEFPIFGVA